jgi:hypothetical protein
MRIEAGEHRGMRIALPQVIRATGCQAHPFPFQIAFQTQEFLQGLGFYVSFTHIAAGQIVRQPDGIERVERTMRDEGLNTGVTEQAWSILRKYERVFNNFVFQSALIGLNSHWDWYVRRLCEFIQFAHSAVGGSPLSRSDEKRLCRADRLPIGEQIEVIELGIGVPLVAAASELHELTEMSLVRNLGLHNRWEVDVQYLGKTSRTDLEVGDLRLICQSELMSWHSLLINLVNKSGVECAKRFFMAPDFPSKSLGRP